MSKNSFAENKAEPMHDAHESIRNIATLNHPNTTLLLTTHLIRQLSQPIFRNSIQIRGFRTQRNIESQLKRNPSFMSRIQEYFGKKPKLTRTSLNINSYVYFVFFSASFQS